MKNRNMLLACAVMLLSGCMLTPHVNGMAERPDSRENLAQSRASAQQRTAATDAALENTDAVQERVVR